MEKLEINTSANKEALLLGRIYTFLLRQARQRDLLKSTEEITMLTDDAVDAVTPKHLMPTGNLHANTVDMRSNPAHDIIHPGGCEHGGMDHDQ